MKTRLLLFGILLGGIGLISLMRWQSSREAFARRLSAWESSERDAALSFERELERKVTLADGTLNLVEFASLVRNNCDLEVEINEPAITQWLGNPRVHEVHVTRGKLSLRNHLRLALEPLGLTADLHGRRLIITAEALLPQPRLKTVVYPLPQPEFGSLSTAEWTDAVTSLIEPENWDDVGGPGHLTSVPGALIVVQTDSVHQQIRSLIDLLATQGDRLDSFQSHPLAPATPTERRIQQALQEPSDIECDGVPLNSLLTNLGERHEIPIHLEPGRLQEAGVKLDIPVTRHLTGMKLQSALRLFLDELELTYIIRDDMLLITTPEDMESHLTTRLYPVHDLVETPGGSDIDSLIELVTTCIAPESWDEVGGPAPLTNLGSGWLIIPQTDEIHEQIEQLLAQLRLALSYDEHASVLDITMPTAAEKEIKAVLDREIDFEYADAKLSDICRDLSGRTNIPIEINLGPLEDIDFDLKRSITCKFPRGPLRSQLRLMLNELDLVYLVRDEVVQISTQDDAERRQKTRLFDVRPLCDPDLGIFDAAGLIEWITTFVEPNSWDEVGGPGSVDVYRGLLVIRQTDEYLLEVEHFVNALEKHCRPGLPASDAPHTVLVDDSSHRMGIEQTLQTTVEAHYVGGEFTDVVSQIAALHQLPLVINHHRLDVLGFNTALPISFGVAGCSLENALDALLRPLELSYIIQDHVVLISSRSDIEERLSTRLYGVGDLVQLDNEPEWLRFRNRLAVATKPSYWKDFEGPRAIRQLGKEWIVVSAHEPMHRSISDFLIGERTGTRPNRKANVEYLEFPSSEKTIDPFAAPQAPLFPREEVKAPAPAGEHP